MQNQKIKSVSKLSSFFCLWFRHLKNAIIYEEIQSVASAGNSDKV